MLEPGFATLNVSGLARGTEVTLRYGEVLNKDGSVDMAWCGSASLSLCLSLLLSLSLSLSLALPHLHPPTHPPTQVWGAVRRRARGREFCQSD